MTATARRLRSAFALAAGLALLAGCANIPPPPELKPGEYRVSGGRVDAGTYNGWRIFHTSCYGCHGVDAVGTDRAPNLLERVRTMSMRAFATKVLTSYRIVAPDTRGDDPTSAREAMIEEVMRQQRGGPRARVVMPAWDDNPVVQPHVLDLYAYLSARADGALGPGRPAR